MSRRRTCRRVQHRHDHLDGGPLSTGCMSIGMPRPLSGTRTPPSSCNTTSTAWRAAIASSTASSTISQTRWADDATGWSRCTCRPLADRIESLENGDRRRAVAALLLDGNVRSPCLTTDDTDSRHRESCSDRTPRDDPDMSSIIPGRPTERGRTPLSGPQAANDASGRVPTGGEGSDGALVLHVRRATCCAVANCADLSVRAPAPGSRRPRILSHHLAPRRAKKPKGRRAE